MIVFNLRYLASINLFHFGFSKILVGVALLLFILSIKIHWKIGTLYHHFQNSTLSVSHLQNSYLLSPKIFASFELVRVALEKSICEILKECMINSSSIFIIQNPVYTIHAGIIRM